MTGSSSITTSSTFAARASCGRRVASNGFASAISTTRPAACVSRIGFAADFADLFEVRGMVREKRGQVHEPEIRRRAGDAELYGPRRSPEIDDSALRSCAGGADRQSGCRSTFNSGRRADALDLRRDRLPARGFAAAGRSAPILLRFATRGGNCGPRSSRAASIASSNEIFNEAARRAVADLYMLMTEMPEGPYPYAGIPWFSTVFGRDGLITAMMMLWLDPTVARGVLGHLAATQATEIDPAADAEPGKILHEARHGEMADLRRGAVSPLLRQRRFHAALRDAGGRISRPHRRRRDAAGASGRTSRRRLAGSRPMATETATDLSNTDGGPFRASPTRAGRTAMTRFSMPTARWPKARSRSSKSRPMSLPPGGPPSGSCAGSGKPDRAAAIRREGGGAARALRRAVLRCGARHLCPGARRRQEALPRPRVQCGPCAVRWHRAAGTGGSGGAGPDGQFEFLRLGHSHRRVGRGALQSDELSQRLGLAARQCADRRRLRPLRQARGHGADVRGPVRRLDLCGLAPASGAVLRLPAPAEPRADLLSGRLQPSGLGGGRAAVSAPVVPWLELRGGGEPQSSFAGRCCRTSSTKSRSRG